jgi:hypothetical protein
MFILCLGLWLLLRDCHCGPKLPVYMVPIFRHYINRYGGVGTKSYMGSILESRSKTSGDVRVP